MHVAKFSLPKAGHSAAEYEDAGGYDAEHMRFAIADGATESSFSGCWARLLVDAFLENPPAKPVQAWTGRLPMVQAKWAKEVDGKAMAWYAEEKLREGASATFLGVVFRQYRLLPLPGFRRRTWQALAVGDSCLFQVRQGKLLRAFPVQRSQEFGNTPCLVNSRLPLAETTRLKACRKLSGQWTPADQFFLMTDALAHWFLQEHEQGRQPAAELEARLAAAAGEQDFADWIDGLRRSKALRNDDVTLIAINLSNPQEQ